MSFTLKPAAGEDFFNREELLHEMLTTLTNTRVDMGFALIGSRRTGKTSILREVARRLNQESEIVAIYLSVWELVENTLREFSQELTTATFDVFKPRFATRHKLKKLLRVPAKKVYELLKTLDIRIKLMDEIEVELARRERRIDAGGLLEDVFGLIENLSRDFAVRSVLIIDEFPSLIDLKNGKKIGEGIIRKIRTINEGLQNTVLCISGSIRKTMEIALLSPTSPFYRQFIVRKVGPLDKPSVNGLLEKNLTRPISQDAMDEVYNLTYGIPFYVQFIGRELERRPESSINRTSVIQAFAEMLQQEGDVIFAQEFYSLNDKERVILKTMAMGDVDKPSAIAHQLNETPNVIGKYLEHLVYKGVIHKQTKGKYDVTDPVFKSWLRARFR
jgi:AAA+ ATPase superfamily predicted ATPase